MVKGNRRIYDWEKLLTQSRFTMRRGEHFPAECMTSSMAQQIRNAASRYGAKVSIRIDDKAIRVSVYKKACKDGTIRK